MCGKNHNLKSSCDILFWTVEDTQASSTFFSGKLKIISTANFDICALQLSERRRGLYFECTAVVFVVGRHGVMASWFLPAIDFLSIPKGPFVFVSAHR